MSRLIIASNRLPIKLSKKQDKLVASPSTGGLATGLKSYHKDNNSVWIGWPGMNTEDEAEKEEIEKIVKKEQCLPIFLSDKLIENYYDGFSNATLWPLFHYFTEYTVFQDKFWDAYSHVNQLFADEIIRNAEENDMVWVHDYQLLLVPKLIREKRPDLQIGLFLHIPFPSYEIIRIIPWREEIIEGMLGADLIGFHTYDYARHFVSSAKRLFGFDSEFNQIKTPERIIHVDVFPMGIDYEKFDSLSRKIQSKSIQERSKEHQDIDRFLMSVPDRQIILSIDRLDYTKGIPERLKAFNHFLQSHPEYHEKVSLIMLTVPSREDVEQYQQLKTEVDVLVGKINGTFGTINWTPVIYFYRSVPFENLIELFSSADVALLTPLRDGMNLVAKEYIASKVNRHGVLILSEMAGAAKELGEAISVNPNDIKSTSKAIYKALTMSDDEKEKQIQSMQRRLKRYDIHKWAFEFIESLKKIRLNQVDNLAKKMTPKVKQEIQQHFKKCSQKVIFLDYDGTLQQFFNDPQDAYPDEELYDLLDQLNAPDATKLVLISGRDKETFDKWFADKTYTLIAEHGAWFKESGDAWTELKTLHTEWKENILPILESYVDRTPGSFIEEKSYSYAWHYRKSDIELSALRALEMVQDLSNLIINQDLEVLEGKKVIEIKVSGINKGAAAAEYLFHHPAECVLAIGDDWTDEFLFKELPETAHTIKVGSDSSLANYFLDNFKDVRQFLKLLTNKS